MRSRGLIGLLPAVAIGAAVSAGPANAERSGDEASSWLRLQRMPGAESCFDASELANEIREQVGTPPETAAQRARLTILVVLERQSSVASSWRATVSTIDAAGSAVARRTIERDDDTCTATSRAAAVVAALLLEHPEPPDVPDGRRPSPSFRLVWAGAVQAAAGTLPQWGPGWSVAGTALFPPRFGVYVRIDAWPAQTVNIEPGHALRTSLLGLGTGACITLSPSSPSHDWFTLGGCLGGSARRLVAHGIGFVESFGPSEAWSAAAVLSVWWHQPIWRGILAVVGLRGEVPLVRETFAYYGGSAQLAERRNLFSMSPVSPAAEVGLGYRWP